MRGSNADTVAEDGFYAEGDQIPTDGPKQKQKVLAKIPTSVIKNAKGLAIFTTMRTGLWMSGAGGSGILIARKEDGSWSPPSGILLHTAGLGFMVGIDIYDCVVVINSEKALEAFYKIRCTLGSEVSVAAGPVGAGGVLESEVHKRQAPIFTYMKSRGFYAGVQIDGTIIIERTDENERFYGERIGVKDILAGKVRHPPLEVRRLLETIKAAQGDSDVDESFLPNEPPPGDYEVDDGHVFGVPDREDPDPYGVLALEKEGMGLREAATKERPSWEQFSFNPSPTSPLTSVFNRSSTDRPQSQISHRSSWRTSTMSQMNTSRASKAQSSLRNSIDKSSSVRNSTDKPPSLMIDSSTQTDFPDVPSPGRSSVRSTASHSRRSSKSSVSHSHRSSRMQEVPENAALDTSPERKEQDTTSHANGHLTPPSTPPASGEVKPELPAPKPIEEAHDHDNEHEDLDDDAHIEEPVVQSVQTVQPASRQVISKARMVNVPKRIPPKLPPRNPNRGERKGPVVIGGSPSESPIKEDTDLASPNELASPPVLDEDAVDGVEKRMDGISLEDNEEPELERPDMWAKVQEARKSQEEQDKKRESVQMPGGFD